MKPLQADDLSHIQTRLDDALRQLRALVGECQGLLATTRELAGLPADDAVDDLLHRLGDDAPVDDFEAGRRRDRRRHPRSPPLS